MKLNGWIRIGIALSVLWIFAVALTATYELGAHRLAHNTFIVWKSRTGEDYSQVTRTTGEFADLVPFHASLRAPYFFGVLFLPVVCAWILAYTLVYTVAQLQVIGLDLGGAKIESGVDHTRVRQDCQQITRRPERRLLSAQGRGQVQLQKVLSFVDRFAKQPES